MGAPMRSSTRPALGAMLPRGMMPNVPEEVLMMVRGVEEPGWLADLIAFSPEFSSEQRQQLLEEFDPVARLKSVALFVQRRLDVLSLRQQIQAEALAEVQNR